MFDPFFHQPFVAVLFSTRHTLMFSIGFGCHCWGTNNQNCSKCHHCLCFEVWLEYLVSLTKLDHGSCCAIFHQLKPVTENVKKSQSIHNYISGWVRTPSLHSPQQKATTIVTTPKELTQSITSLWYLVFFLLSTRYLFYCFNS